MLKQKYLTKIFLIIISLFLLTSESKSSVSLCQKIQTAASEKSQFLPQLLKQIQSTSEQCLVRLTPKYYWAQSMTHLYLKFEFINSPDTSSCGQILAFNTKTDHNLIELSVVCLQGSMVIRYLLSITTFMPLNFYHAEWKRPQPNTVLFQCPKSPSPYFWKKLYVSNIEPTRLPKLWWEIQQKFKENLGDFIYDLELQDKEQTVSMENKQKRPKQESINPYSDIHFYCHATNPRHLGSWL